VSGLGKNKKKIVKIKKSASRRCWTREARPGWFVEVVEE
jgi:hypothetical protein